MKLLKYLNFNKVVVFSLLSIPAFVTLMSTKDCWGEITSLSDVSPKGFADQIKLYKKPPSKLTKEELEILLTKEELEILLANNIGYFFKSDINKTYKNKKKLQYSDLKIKVTIKDFDQKQRLDPKYITQEKALKIFYLDESSTLIGEIDYFEMLNYETLSANKLTSQKEFNPVIQALIKHLLLQQSNNPKHEDLLKTKKEFNDAFLNLKTFKDINNHFNDLIIKTPIISNLLNQLDIKNQDYKIADTKNAAAIESYKKAEEAYNTVYKDLTQINQKLTINVNTNLFVLVDGTKLTPAEFNLAKAEWDAIKANTLSPDKKTKAKATFIANSNVTEVSLKDGTKLTPAEFNLAKAEWDAIKANNLSPNKKIKAKETFTKLASLKASLAQLLTVKNTQEQLKNEQSLSFTTAIQNKNTVQDNFFNEIKKSSNPLLTKPNINNSQQLTELEQKISDLIFKNEADFLTFFKSEKLNIDTKTKTDFVAIKKALKKDDKVSKKALNKQVKAFLTNEQKNNNRSFKLFAKVSED